jgi:hypothetical protein
MSEKEDTKERNFEATLVFLLDRKTVWLAPKKAKIGEKRLNGYGGEIELYDLTKEDAAKRETHQEARVHVKKEDLELFAIGYFTNIKNNGTHFVCKVYIYRTRRYIGNPKASKEMGKPHKFNKYNMPYRRMMAADKYFLSELFSDKKIIIRATLRNKQSELVGKPEITYVDSFE